MSVVVNSVRRGAYLDSVALMRISREVAAAEGVEEAGLMIATPANLEILAEAGVLAAEGRVAGPGDLVLAVRARDEATARAALALASRLIDARPKAAASGQAWRPRSLRGAVEAMPDASLALISVPGPFAAAEARKAMRRGLDVMIFSDNVPIDDEVALKREADALGRLVMGPDCGTAIIAGTPLAFANAVPRGDIGLIGASGTGLQEVSCLIARARQGVSHAVGTGGRDLTSEVGGLTTLRAIDLLEADPATRQIVLISKPPAPEVRARVLDRLGRAAKPAIVCFIGALPDQLAGHVRAARTLADAARMAAGAAGPSVSDEVCVERPAGARRGRVCGLFAGGTLAAEAQVVLLTAGLRVAANAPVPGASSQTSGAGGHLLLDLGDDAYTRGRPHPMIEPSVRDGPLAAALADPSVGVILLDCVLGTGSHADPGGHLARRLADRPTNGPAIVASVTGTDEDVQSRARQVAQLEAVGVIVAPSNAAAAGLAARYASASG